MRPLLLAATLAVPFLHGCAKTCTTEGLQASLSALPDPTPAATAKAVATACPDDTSLNGWLADPDAAPSAAAWSAACAGDVDVASLTSAPMYHNRKVAFEQCNVFETGVADVHAFTHASNNPARAVAAARALMANEKVDKATATKVGMSLIGRQWTPLPAIELPRVEGVATKKTAPATITVTPMSVTVDGKSVFLRSLEPQADAVLAVSADVPANALLRAVAAVTPPGDTTPVWVMATVDGRDDRPALLDLGHASSDADTASFLAHTPGQTSADYLSQAAKQGSTPNIDTRLGLCEDAPTGMVCVQGGAVSDTTRVSTFYADAMEATVKEYKACVEAGACTAIATRAAADQPIQGLSFIDARMYCSYAGKRLPTQWEFKRLAQGTPADQAGTCENNQHNKCEGGVRKASAGSPNQWGAFNVLGNVAEATSTYPPKGNERCGDRCEGLDPVGFCDGAPMCKGRLSRIFEGGSASTPPPATGWPAAAITHKKRRLASQGVRCVSDDVVLESLPSEWVQSPPAAPTMPAALDEAGQAIMAAIAEDNINEIPECDDGRRGSSRTDCKDPTHYIYPNEDRAPITYPYIKNRGGALLGVGSDQNYTFAAIAKSEIVFLMDYDAIVVHIHRVNQAFIKHADTPDGFVAMWDPKNRAESLKVIENEWKGDPMMPTYQRTLRSLNNIMFGHYKRTRAPSESGATSWLRDADAYAWVRNLWLGGRMISLKGDMMGPNAMMGAGEALKKLKVPMRIYYTSNAPNAWGGMMTPDYKRNVRNFPMDEQSIVLQALGWVNEFGQTGHWHFNVQDGPQVQERLGQDGYKLLWQVVRPYRNTDDVDLSLSGIRGTWADAHAQ